MKPMVSQTMAYQETSNDALGKSSHPLSSLWILDAGATDNIVRNSTYFYSCFHFVFLFSQLPKQLSFPGTHKGTTIKSSACSDRCTMCSFFQIQSFICE